MTEIDEVDRELIESVDISIKSAEYEFSKLSNDILEVSGPSGKKNRIFFNNLLQITSSRLLHIANGDKGVIYSALYNNNSKVFLIDDYNSRNENTDEFMTNIELYKGNNYFRFFNDNYNNVNTQRLFKFNIFSFHASIDYNKIYTALPKFIDNMNDTFIVVYNDINWTFILEAAKKSFNDLKLTVLFEKEIRLTNNETHTPMSIARDSWWNGIYIAVLKKNKL